MLIYDFNNFRYNIFITMFYFMLFPYDHLENNNLKMINEYIIWEREEREKLCRNK